ncbi:IS3 family transposase, partial [bacterium]|nr:IS3 family transposase [bacterium]
MEQHETQHPIQDLCRVLCVSRSGYYKWRCHKPSRREKANTGIMAEIQAVHAKSRASYGSPRIQAALKKGGMCLSRKRVAGLMKRLGLHGSQKRRFRPVTTESHHDYPVSENRLRSLESVERPDQVWVSDITYIQTAGRWSYLAVVMDLFNREVKGWSLEFHLRSELIQAAFQKACYRYEPGEGILFHSDRGCQYASTAFR